jgi:hypothetical protein
MNQAPEDQQITINIVQGQDGVGFDQPYFHMPVGAITIWVNLTDTSQVIIPDNQDTRRVMTLAPIGGEEGAVWMMQMRSSQRSSSPGTFRWRLKSNASAHITITTTQILMEETD